MTSAEDFNDWRWQLKHAERTGSCPEAERLHPSFYTPYWKQLLRHRAIRLQTLPSLHELEEEEGMSADPFGEGGVAAKCPGLKQRFPDRVLVMASTRCAMNCRHCTRRGLLKQATTVADPARLSAAVAWMRRHPRVRDVLISGGDPLMLSDAALLRIVRAFAALPQVDVVRVCTRMPCTLPMRLTPALVRGLRTVGAGKVVVNTQFNCAEELTRAARAACARLADAGIPVSCQTVLLRGVNDSLPKLFALCTALQRARVRPYYVFVCDPIAGIGHLRVPVEKAAALERALAERIGGLALPRFVADLPGARRKIPVADLVR